MHTRRPRLTPPIADARRAVRESLASVASGSLVLVGLSGGADSLALAAAVAFEAPRMSLRAGAVIVDHGLQEGSADVAATVARQAEQLGLNPVVVRRVRVGVDGGPEAAARAARYAAFAAVARETDASAVLLGHTLDDQAETVLLGLARGSGIRSLAGMAPIVELRRTPLPSALEGAFDATRGGFGEAGAAEGGDGENARGEGGLAEGGADGLGPGEEEAGGLGSGVGGAGGLEREGGRVLLLRPLLGMRRSDTEAACADAGLTPWNDPHNTDAAYTRVRVRTTVLPVLERELGPGIAEALARTAEQAREDADALDHFVDEMVEEVAAHAEAGISLEVGSLEANPPALRHRLIRLAASAEFGVPLSRAHTLEVARLVTDWRGQGPLHLPGIRVERQGARIVFSAADHSDGDGGTENRHVEGGDGGDTDHGDTDGNATRQSDSTDTSGSSDAGI